MEIIQNTSYEKLCDTTWKEGDLPPDGSVVHVNLDEIVPFFDKVKRSDKVYSVISSNSDYGICYQNDYPVNKDMLSWLKFVDCKGIGYNSLVIPSRCDIEQCRITDIYSIKMYSFTKFTFDEIPANIKKWFCVNSNIEDSRIVNIPFGIPSWSEPLLKITAKDKSLYVNMMLNTVERASLMNYYRQYTHNDLICEKEVSHERFIDCLARSRMILASSGNGWDQYRILESLYCGSIPIVSKGIWNKAYDRLPVIALDSLYLDINEINLIFDELNSKANWDLTNTYADLNYWRNQVNQARDLL